MKKLLLGIGVGIGVVTALTLAPVEFEPVKNTSAASENQTSGFYEGDDGCPDGSYNIGTKDGVNPICKLEPTGCPYGDSIPLDSPKCAPSPEELAKQKEAENVSNSSNGSTPSQKEQSVGSSCSK